MVKLYDARANSLQLYALVKLSSTQALVSTRQCCAMAHPFCMHTRSCLPVSDVASTVQTYVADILYTIGDNISGSNDSNTGILAGIIGGIVAVIAVIIIVIIVYVVACHRKKGIAGKPNG